MRPSASKSQLPSHVRIALARALDPIQPVKEPQTHCDGDIKDRLADFSFELAVHCSHVPHSSLSALIIERCFEIFLPPPRRRFLTDLSRYVNDPVDFFAEK